MLCVSPGGNIIRGVGSIAGGVTGIVMCSTVVGVDTMTMT